MEWYYDIVVGLLTASGLSIAVNVQRVAQSLERFEKKFQLVVEADE